PNEKKSDNIMEAIINEGGEAKEIMTDISSLDNVSKMFDQIINKYGHLDILVNNAGTSQDKDIFNIDDNDWKRIININLTSGFYCSKMALPLMRGQCYGKIVFISSVVAHRGAINGHIHYAASKSGQLGLMKTLARTAAPYGINVNAVAPGIIKTDLL